MFSRHLIKTYNFFIYYIFYYYSFRRVDIFFCKTRPDRSRSICSGALEWSSEIDKFGVHFLSFQYWLAVIISDVLNLRGYGSGSASTLKCKCMFGSRSNCPARPIIGRPIRAETSPSIADYAPSAINFAYPPPSHSENIVRIFLRRTVLTNKKKRARFYLKTLRIDLVQSESAMGNCELNFELWNVIDNSELTLRATFGYGSCKHHPRIYGTCI